MFPLQRRKQKLRKVKLTFHSWKMVMSGQAPSVAASLATLSTSRILFHPYWNAVPASAAWNSQISGAGESQEKALVSAMGLDTDPHQPSHHTSFAGDCSFHMWVSTWPKIKAFRHGMMSECQEGHISGVWRTCVVFMISQGIFSSPFFSTGTKPRALCIPY